MGKIDALMWTEQAWHPKLQHTNNAELMELFIALPATTTRQLDKCNQGRLYLRVITLSDLAHEFGGYIPDEVVIGKWQAGSDLE